MGNHHFGENLMHEEDPDLLAGEALDRLRGRNTADEIKQLRKERDEARREIMNSVIDQACSNEEIEEEYRKRGWSYLKKENTNG